MTNIFVSNLSFNIENEDLKQVFEDYGEVTSAKVITDQATGRPRGFGFVEMTNDEHAQNAIKELNGATYDGKVLAVSVAKPREKKDNSFRRTGGGGSGSGRPRFGSNRY
ncbi:MAG: RNA-binding protein [Bacteroidota bacterium]